MACVYGCGMSSLQSSNTSSRSDGSVPAVPFLISSCEAHDLGASASHTDTTAHHTSTQAAGRAAQSDLSSSPHPKRLGLGTNKHAMRRQALCTTSTVVLSANSNDVQPAACDLRAHSACAHVARQAGCGVGDTSCYVGGRGCPGRRFDELGLTGKGLTCTATNVFTPPTWMPAHQAATAACVCKRSSHRLAVEQSHQLAHITPTRTAELGWEQFCLADSSWLLVD